MTRDVSTKLRFLREEHAELKSLARQLSTMIAHDEPPPPGDLYKLQMKLTSVLIRHLKTEDWVLYPSLLRSSNEQVATTARAFSAAMGGLAGDFGEYANVWGPEAIQNDWKGYQRDTTELLRALTLRMTREERDLYPLLDEAEGVQPSHDPELRYASRERLLSPDFEGAQIS